MKRAAVIVDSSVWIDALSGRTFAAIEDAMADGTLLLSPLVIAELLSGDVSLSQRKMIGNLLQEFPLHPTPLGHWIGLGALRRMLRGHGVNVTIPDAHLAQCALEAGAAVVSRDEIFTRIAGHTTLRVLR